MTEIIITENDGGQRLDRFLRKYLSQAPLSAVYRMIRKDVKVNGRRAHQETMLRTGDVLRLYISDEDLEKYTSVKTRTHRARKSFAAAYEDDCILAAVKPAGLLVHGDSREKKDTLVNQVTDYLIEKGEYVPRLEKSFAPAAANRLDRNTSGLVLFGKNAPALRALAGMIRRKGSVRKFYLALVKGSLREELHLTGSLIKDRENNRVRVSQDSGDSLSAETFVKPLVSGGGMTLAEVELITGRSHQIRAHLSEAGFPIAGDPKYGDPGFNREYVKKYGLRAQFLHAYRLRFDDADEPLEYLRGKEISAQLPDRMERMAAELFGEEAVKRIVSADAEFAGGVQL